MPGTSPKAPFLLPGHVFIYSYVYIYFGAVGINICQLQPKVCTLLRQTTNQESCPAVPKLQKHPRIIHLGRLTAASLTQMLPGNGPGITTE